MCKVFVMTDTSKIKNLDKAVEKICEHITKFEVDGFGYAVQGTQGVFGERTIYPAGFKSSFNRQVLDLPFSTPTYNRFGQKSKPKGAGIFHGRTSTNNVNIQNTHPINKGGWSLIHNGVVSNHGPKYQMETSNDTEHLVQYMSTSGISDIEKHITGYYAFAALDPQGDLHIVRDSIAPLYVAWIETVNSWVFATTEGLIESICKDMKWKHSIIDWVNDDTYLVYQGNTMVNHWDIKPRGRTAYESQFSEKSLGKVLDFDSKNETPSLEGVMKYDTELWEAHGYTPSEIKFLQEVNYHADSTYKFFDYKSNELSFKEFDDLEDNEKLYCTVVRSDGTIVSQDNYEDEKLWQGA